MRHSWDHLITGGQTLQYIHDRRIVPFHTSVVQPRLSDGQNVLTVTSHAPMQAYVKLLEGVPQANIGEIAIGTAEVRIYEVGEQAQVMDRSIHAIGNVY